MSSRVEKTNKEWAQILTPEEFKICRKKGEEKPYEGKYYMSETPGTYHCKCCDTPLFDSSTKYLCGVGWPAFHHPINEACVNTQKERNFFLGRIQATCSACDSHLGYVFDDGPGPTGLRYCIYSISIRLEEREEKVEVEVEVEVETNSIENEQG